MTLVEQIRKELEPYRVEGFTAKCCPTPSMDQIERLIAEVERLTAERDGLRKIGTVCVYDGSTNTQYDSLKGIERGTYDLYAAVK